MAAAPTLNCKARKLSTHGYLNQMKREGWVPGVIYSKEKENQAILLPAKELKRVFTHTGARGVFMLQIEGEPSPLMVIIREIQKTPLGDEFSHIDFLPLKSNEKVHTMVGVHFLGEEELIAEGKMLQVITKEVEVSCLPADIPEYFSIDLSSMNMGDKVLLENLSLPANVELLQDPATVICIIMGQSKMDTDLEPASEQPTETAE